MDYSSKSIREENIGENRSDLWYWGKFLDAKLKIQSMKEKLEKLDFIPGFLCKKTLEKIFANHISGKGLVFRAHKDLLKLYNRKQKFN